MSDITATGFTVRPAVPGDAEGIANVHVRSWQAAYQGKIPQDYLDGLDPADRVDRWRGSLERTDRSRADTLVAVSAGPDGRVLGFANVGAAPDAAPGTGHLYAIYLLPDAWGQGAGRALMTAAVERLAELGHTEATLWVLDTNDRARRFYEAAGWTADGAVQADDSRGFTLREVRYRRALP